MIVNTNIINISKNKNVDLLTAFIEVRKSLIIDTKFKSVAMLYHRKRIPRNGERKIECSLVSIMQNLVKNLSSSFRIFVSTYELFS